jgi:hypothetical protein
MLMAEVSLHLLTTLGIRTQVATANNIKFVNDKDSEIALICIVV